jgi:phytoene synthase
VDISHSGFRSATEAINDWEHAYWQAFETHSSDHPVMRAYLDTALTFGIPAETMVAYFRAMREDLTVMRYPTFDDLLHYMEGSAIPVGRAMVHILGVKPPHAIETALPHADSLAIAMQLSNFWRDIGEDWARGRIYIPQEDMVRFGVREDDLKTGHITQAFINLLDFEIDRAMRYYNHAAQGVRFLAAGRWGVRSSLRIYRAILTHIRRQDYDVFSRRAGANVWQRVGHVLCALV